MANKSDDVMSKMIEGSAATENSAAGEAEGRNIDAMMTVPLKISAVLGYARMPISAILKCEQGTVIELDRELGQPVDIIVQDTVIGRGNLVQVGENGVGVTLTEIVKKFEPTA